MSLITTQHIILPEPTLRRLPWYLAYIETLMARGEQHISSTGISKALNVDSSQIAKDLSFLNIKGKTRIGYNVSELAEALSAFLGFKQAHKACIFGTGSLGKALIRDKGLANYGLQIVGAFDVNQRIVGTCIEDVPVSGLEDINMVFETFEPVVAIITVPPDVAQEVADTAIKAGFKAIWNFTPYRVRVPEHIVMANTSIYAHLALIYNRLKAN